MLNWSMLDLAQAARVSVSTVKRCEVAGGAAVAHATLDAVRETLERRGVQFLADEGQGAGLRFDPSAQFRNAVFSRFL